jgi:hypothetical protein
MASRDIVHQMTDEMGMNQQMLQNMQHQQMSQMPMPAGMQQPAAVDFGQLSPEQQMMMMQQPVHQPQQMMPPMAPPPPQHVPQQPYDDSSSISSSSSDSSASSGDGSVNLDKLGLGVSSNRGWLDMILHYLKDPIVVIAIVVLMSLPWIDSVLKPMVPYGLAYGTYYLGIKGLLAGALYFVLKLVLG